VIVPLEYIPHSGRTLRGGKMVDFIRHGQKHHGRRAFAAADRANDPTRAMKEDEDSVILAPVTKKVHDYWRSRVFQSRLRIPQSLL
jgi:hypothetical protein